MEKKKKKKWENIHRKNGKIWEINGGCHKKIKYISANYNTQEIDSGFHHTRNLMLSWGLF